MSLNAFAPQGNTVLITAAVSPPTGVQVPTFGTLTTNAQQFRIKNSATVDVAIGYGNTAGAAQTNAVIPGAASQSVIVGAGQTEVFTFPPGSFFSAAVAATPGPVYITPGDGT